MGLNTKITKRGCDYVLGPFTTKSYTIPKRNGSIKIEESNTIKIIVPYLWKNENENKQEFFFIEQNNKIIKSLISKYSLIQLGLPKEITEITWYDLKKIDEKGEIKYR